MYAKRFWTCITISQNKSINFMFMSKKKVHRPLLTLSVLTTDYRRSICINVLSNFLNKNFDIFWDFSEKNHWYNKVLIVISPPKNYSTG